MTVLEEQPASGSEHSRCFANDVAVGKQRVGAGAERSARLKAAIALLQMGIDLSRRDSLRHQKGMRPSSMSRHITQSPAKL